jgi:tripartite-type tricarboxylate transporter receptor subunit TctC
MTRRAIAGAAALLGFLATTALPCAAANDSVADFYKGKVVKFILSAGEGGGYGTYALAVEPFMERYIPGHPNIIIQHMQGAGGLVAANNLYNVQPKDGSVFALIHRGAVSTTPLYGAKNVRFDPTKFGWIGSLNSEVSFCVSWHTTPVKTFDDLKKYPLTVGGLGPGADTDQFTYLIDNLFGAKMRLVTGYHSGGEIDLAMERGEIGGRCGWSWSTIISTKAAWLKEKKFNLLVQIGVDKHPDVPDVPLLSDFAKTDQQRDIIDIVVAPQLMGRPVLTTPGVPAERLTALRDALKKSMADPAFLAVAKKENLEVSYVSGERIEATLKKLYALPKSVLDAAAKAVSKPD